MSPLMIAWRSIQQRGFASLLTTLSMALGVTLVVAILSINGIVQRSFVENSSSLGYSTIVGAKGGKLQLTLNTVYYLSQPIENIPYDYYLEFQPADRRDEEWKNSIRYRTHLAAWQSMSSQHALTGLNGGLESLLFDQAQETFQASDLDERDFGRPGNKAPGLEFAIPVCLGDYYGQYRVVGTTPEFFTKLLDDDEDDPQPRFKFAQGRNLGNESFDTHFYECVVGSAVAKDKKVTLEQRIAPAHGAPGGDEHSKGFIVVGILKPSGTPVDRAVFVNMEGFFLLENHAKPLPKVEAEEDPTTLFNEEAGQETDMQMVETAEASRPGLSRVEPLPVEQREVTAMLVRTTDNFYTPIFVDRINEEAVAQAVSPIQQIYILVNVFVSPVQWLLLIIAAMVCVVSGIGILVSIYNSMAERRHDIAIMRALGASRGTVVTIIFLETIMLVIGGCLVGWVGAHVLNVLASPAILERTGVSVGFFDFAPPLQFMEGTGISAECLVIPFLLILSALVGILPAVTAYRTDVSASLNK